MSYRGAEPNFGDDLNRVLWPALIPGLFGDDAADDVGSGGDGVGFVGIGTIVGMPVRGLHRLEVFSSGAGSDPRDGWAGLDVRYHCVRGPVTARILGLPADAAVADGALLAPVCPGLPLMADGYWPQFSGPDARKPVVVVPHWESLHHAGWDEAARLAGFELVDPRASPASVVRRLAAARLVLAESMHAAILADTYGVPWVAFATTANFNVTKWTDWAMSVGVEHPEAVAVPPPSASAVLAFGRPRAAWGGTLRLSAAEAVDSYRLRLERSSGTSRGAVAALKGWAKHRLPGIAQLTLLLSPERTAEALDRLASAPGTARLSSSAARTARRERLLELLDAFARSRGVGLRPA